jgi:1,4-alpha-glucan branching enzyme
MPNQKQTKNNASTQAHERVLDQQKIQRELEKPELPSRSRAGKEKQVTITFNVTVPESTAGLRRSVFLVGNFQKLNKNLVDWDTRVQPMKKVDNRHWTISLTELDNTEIEYKYCLGDWDTVERDEHCMDIFNRRVRLHLSEKEPQEVHDTVHNWRGVNPCSL